MYKFERYRQLANQPVGLKMDTNNCWVREATTIFWETIEEKFAELFPSDADIHTQPLRTALESLIIQKQYGYSDRKLVEQIKKNPYYQYFIGLPGYQHHQPFVFSLLVEFRKRLGDDVMMGINEMIIAYSAPDDSEPEDGGGSASNVETEKQENIGTITFATTCALQNINLLNEAKENLEKMIDRICYDHNYYRSRMYRENARRDYMNLQSAKRTAKRLVRR